MNWGDRVGVTRMANDELRNRRLERVVLNLFIADRSDDAGGGVMYSHTKP